MRLPALALALLVGTAAATGCLAQDPPPDVRRGLAPQSTATARLPAPERGADGPYTVGPPSADGTGRVYMGRELAHPMSHRGAAWLERSDRERDERPDAVVDALGLAEDAVVVDLGAGTGYFTRRLAPRVPRGRVIAVDIQPEMLDILRRQVDTEGITNVETVLGTEQDPGLRPNSVDLTLIVDSYHEFGYPREVMRALHRATRPGGRVVLVEYRGEDPAVPIRALHKMTEAQVRREVEAAGFRFVENRSFLPHQHFLVFERPR
jgi:FkbM family methyltransferase